ncbi:Carbon monoxide dehydrogenase medium chain [bacterium HR24]|nr:Carbon monoxide dehydrogenase medium chain [bacterium HR24]
MRPFAHFAPRSLDEALDIFRREGEGGRPLAGGTDLVVQLKEGGHKFPYPRYLVSLRRLPELRALGWHEEQGLRLGAGLTMAEVASNDWVRQRYPALADGAGLVGSRQTMNMATVGGNVCNAAPSADTAPPLLALEAQARIVGPQGERLLPLEEFWLGPGETVLRHGELLTEFLLPPPLPRSASLYRRHTPRQQMDIAVVGVAVAVALDDGGRTLKKVRIALGAVAPTPIRARRAEAALEGQAPSPEAIARAAAIAQEEARPISDVRGSAALRRHLVGVMTERLLREAIERARRG